MDTAAATTVTFVTADSGIVHFGTKWAEAPGYVMTNCWAGKNGRLSGRATGTQATCKRCLAMVAQP